MTHIHTVRAPFRSVLTLNPRTGILLIVVFGVVPVALVLQANVTGSYQVVSLVFAAMIALPWVRLTQEGRKLIDWCGRHAGAGCCRP